MTTNVPGLTYTATGWVAPAETAILLGVQQDIQAAFAPLLPVGVTLNFTTNTGSQSNPTPQGELAESMTSILGAADEQLILYASLVDPAFSYGRMQDAIGRIYYMLRNTAQSTVATINCVGVNNTPLPAGTGLEDANGNFLTLLSGATIPSGGNISLNFQANIPGPTTIAPPLTPSPSIPGWDTATLVSQVIGTVSESSQAFEARRSQSTSMNGQGNLSNIVGAVLNVSGVVDCRGVANNLNTTQTILPSGQAIGITINANSIYLVVVGGSGSAIAEAIFTKTMPGCQFNGGQIFQIADTGSALAVPYQTYNIAFDYATLLPMVFNINISNVNVPANATTTIQNAIVAAFAGQDVVGYNSMGQPVYGPTVKTGALLVASRFYPTMVNVLWPGASLISITMGSANITSSTFVGSISGLTLTVTQVLTGSLATGQNLLDTLGNITAGTQITGQQSGTAGGIGTYTINISQTVSSENIMGVISSYSELLPNVNQLPAITAANINVNFISPSTS
jgi:hypothetical protein